MAKKKILLLSDDLRMPSGIANISKQLVLGTVDKYDWVQLGAAIKHPEQGKVLDLNNDVRLMTGVADADVKIYPSDGYGNADTIRLLLMREKPDAILHFTDPRYWIWLYDIEHEIRQSVPLLFYHIWDDLPDPLYNRDYYESCDWIGNISKQTYGITKRVWGSKLQSQWKQPDDWQVSYVPHGINQLMYKPVEVPEEFRKNILGDNEYDFILYWNNRNIRRKQPIDAMLAFEEFRKGLPEDKRNKVCMVMHTQPIDENGTDLITVHKHLMPEANVIFDSGRWTETELNYLYNLADVTINLASNEGFGLTTAESVMAGTPIIVNVTGGLQDQCGFSIDGKYLTAEDYVSIGSLHHKSMWENKIQHGEWVRPVWPTRSLNGSVPTPYIFDDKVDYETVSLEIREWYDIGREERKRKGLIGREWMMNEGGLSVDNMCKSLVDGIETTFQKWTPRKKYELFNIF